MKQLGDNVVEIGHTPQIDFNLSSLTKSERHVLDLVLGYGTPLTGNARSFGSATEEEYKKGVARLHINADMTEAITSLRRRGYVYIYVTQLGDCFYAKTASPDQITARSLVRSVSPMSGELEWWLPPDYQYSVDATDEFLAWMDATNESRFDLVKEPEQDRITGQPVDRITGQPVDRSTGSKHPFKAKVSKGRELVLLACQGVGNQNSSGTDA